MFEGLTPPQALKVSRVVGSYEWTNKWRQDLKGVLHLASLGDKPSDVLFISPCAFMEELSNRYGVKPSFLKGPAASIFQRLVHKAGFVDTDFAYTSLVRYNIPGGKPKAADIRWSLPAFHHDIAEFKPKIIVCLGKTPFDQLASIRVKASEMQGAFFDCERYDCLLYLMDPISYLTTKPEYIEKFMTDLKEIRWELMALRGSPRIKLPTNYTVVETADQLVEVVDEANKSGETEVAVDSEWAGQTHVSGKLRAFQFCWKPGRAAAIHFMNEFGERVMDVDDKTVGEILSSYLTRSDVKYIGHFLAADTVWMSKVLGLPIHKKAAFDTMFGLQVCDEYADLKLERLAVRWTDLGRYDLDLFLWKKANKFDEDEGYAKIPSEILLPYALRDADTTKRVKPIILEQMRRQAGLADYYFNICLPFTTDCYAQKMMTGLPVDIKYATKLRDIFVRNQKLLIKDFKEEVKKEADQILQSRLAAINREVGPRLYSDLVNLSSTNPDDAFNQFKEFCGQDKFIEMLPVYEHWLATRLIDVNDPKVGFNHVSSDSMKRWLFDVKGLTPIKSTKKDGMTVSWAKVLEMEPNRRIEFTPACDKQTLHIYADKDPLIAEVEQLKAVSNIVRSFLREPDPETKKEEGIFKWIQPDGSIHPNFAATETGKIKFIAPPSKNVRKQIS